MTNPFPPCLCFMTWKDAMFLLVKTYDFSQKIIWYTAQEWMKNKVNIVKQRIAL